MEDDSQVTLGCIPRWCPQDAAKHLAGARKTARKEDSHETLTGILRGARKTARKEDSQETLTGILRGGNE